MDGVPNTSPAESRSLLCHSWVWAAARGCRRGGRRQDQSCMVGSILPQNSSAASQAQASLANKNLTNRAFHSSAGSRLLPQLTSRQGNESHDFTAKAARLCSGWLSDGKGRCFLYPDTINTFLVTCKTALPLLWPQIPPHSTLDATGSRSHYSHFTLAVTGL